MHLNRESNLPGTVTAIYTALLAILFVGLSVRTLLRRRKIGAAVGDGDDVVLTKAIRAHGNFAEYAPLCLLLMYFLEVVSGAGMLLHVAGVLLLIGRALHAYGVSQVNENYAFRVAGMACTFVVLIGASSRLLVSGFS